MPARPENHRNVWLRIVASASVLGSFAVIASDSPVIPNRSSKMTTEVAAGPNKNTPPQDTIYLGRQLAQLVRVGLELSEKKSNAESAKKLGQLTTRQPLTQPGTQTVKQHIAEQRSPETSTTTTTTPTTTTTTPSQVMNAYPIGILRRIAGCESGGSPYASINYLAQNPNSTASGAFQVLNSTWNNFDGYSSAKYAPPSVQNTFAEHLYAEEGTSPWVSSESCWG